MLVPIGALLTAADETVVHDDQILPAKFRFNRRQFAADTLLPQSLVGEDKSAMDISVLDKRGHVRLA